MSQDVSPSFPTLSPLQLHVHTEYFAFDRVAVQWMQSAHWSHYSPTGLIFGWVCELNVFATWSCKCNRRYKAGDGKVWPGLERRVGGPLSAATISDRAFRAILSPVWITFPESLDLGKGCEEEAWFHTFYLVCSCFGWRTCQTINSSRDPLCASATHHWMTCDGRWLWCVHRKHRYQLHFLFHLGLL